MTNEQRRTLELVFDLTAHPGWKVILSECEEKLASFKEALISPGKTDLYDLGLIRGKASAYSELLNMRNAVETVLNVDEANEQADLL